LRRTVLNKQWLIGLYMKLKNKDSGRIIELKKKPEQKGFKMGEMWRLAMGNAAKRNLNKV